MVKVTRVGGRGTSRRVEEKKDASWAGDKYREEQAKKKAAAGNRRVSTGRGTGSRKLKDTPEPKTRPSTEGMTRVTGRGTGSRKSTNKGTKKKVSS